mgnify:CR=1 FL=1
MTIHPLEAKAKPAMAVPSTSKYGGVAGATQAAPTAVARRQEDVCEEETTATEVQVEGSGWRVLALYCSCLLYTSDAADEHRDV